MSLLIELKNINKIYRTGEQNFLALSDINFTFMRGEMTAINGVSGSGKSTLMNIIGFLDVCSSGHYFFSGQDVSNLQEKQLAKIRNKKIGFIFQSFFLLARASVLQNVMLPLFYRGMPLNQAKQAALSLLEKVRIVHLANHRPNQLSGGQQQRVAIARALVGDPDLILADEPTGALDSQTSEAVMDLLTELNNKEGRSILIITHDKEVSQRCQRIVTIKDGKII